MIKMIDHRSVGATKGDNERLAIEIIRSLDRNGFPKHVVNDFYTYCSIHSLGDEFTQQGLIRKVNFILKPYGMAFRNSRSPMDNNVVFDLIKIY